MTIEPPEPNQPGYALRLSDAERMRYRAMAQRAVAIEGDRWTRSVSPKVPASPTSVAVRERCSFELARRAGHRFEG